MLKVNLFLIRLTLDRMTSVKRASECAFSLAQWAEREKKEVQQSVNMAEPLETLRAKE